MGSCKVDAITGRDSIKQYIESLMPIFKSYEEEGNYECFVVPSDDDVDGEYGPYMEKKTPTESLNAFSEDISKSVHCYFHKNEDYFSIDPVLIHGELVFKLSNFYVKDTATKRHMYPRESIRTESCEGQSAKIYVKGIKLGIDELYSMWHFFL